MSKKTIQISIIVYLICCMAGCSSAFRINVDHSQERQQTTVDDTSDKKTVEETRRKSTKVKAEIKFQRKLSSK